MVPVRLAQPVRANQQRRGQPIQEGLGCLWVKQSFRFPQKPKLFQHCRHATRGGLEGICSHQVGREWQDALGHVEHHTFGLF